jgi:hypothetical protein
MLTRSSLLFNQRAIDQLNVLALEDKYKWALNDLREAFNDDDVANAVS